MKIYVSSGSDYDGVLEIEVDEYSQGENIKYYLNEIRQEDKTWTKDYYRLIYKNIIINDHDFINKYKISDGDEIWHGKIENYLNSDDIIVEVFLAGWVPDWVWLIVKEHDSIKTIRSTLEIFQPKIIHIWNSKGDQMMDNQSVTEINREGYYQLIVRCADEREQNLTFANCCDQHDRFRSKFYFLRFGLYDNTQISSNVITSMQIKTKKIRQIMSTNNKIHAILDTNLSDFPYYYVNSKFLFCNHIYERISEICEEYWELIEDPDNLSDINVCNALYVDEINEWRKIKSYFCLFLLNSSCKYFLVRSDHIENARISYNDIVINALDHFLTLLTEPDDSLKCSINLLMNSFFLIFRSDSQLDDWMGSFNCFRSAVILTINGETHELKVQTDPQNIREAKLEIARNCGASVEDFYCINISNHDQMNDGDPFQGGGILFEKMKRLENFDLGKEIARGGFGIVFHCQEKISGKNLILKNYHLNQAEHLVNGFEIVQDYKDGSINLAMPYMSGGSLTSYIEQCLKQWKCLQEKHIVKISYQILTQINELHECKVIHCDIKPDNIVFDGEGNAKCIDYGLAKHVESLEGKAQSRKRKESSPGTIYYLAPEVIKGELYSYKTDIWSFGMVLVEMVTGKPPFHWAGIGRVSLELTKMKKYKFKPINPISKELNELINLCLTVNPDERPTGEELMKSEFFKDCLHK